MSPNSPVYDVFLSFNTSDQEEVERVASYLVDQGELRVFFSPSSIQGGDNWQERMEVGLRASRHCAVFVGGPQMGPWQKLESELALVRHRRDGSFRVIPVFLPGALRSDIPLNFLELYSRIDLGQDWDLGVAALVRSLKATPPEEEVAPGAQALKEAICPYRDLLPYREEDASAYSSLGQEALIADLERQIRRESFVALLGPSGCGKTSLVQAGLLPRLRTEDAEEREWVSITLKPSKEPWSDLCSALASWLTQELAEQVKLALKWGREIRSGAIGLSQLVSVVLKSLHARRLLLIIDPGEDLWAWASPGTSQFLQEVLEADDLHVLLVLRVDHYGRALEHPIIGPRLPGQTFQMTRMSRDRLKSVITVLAAKGGLGLRPALIADLANELEQAPAALSLLQRVLTEMWRSGQEPSRTYNEKGLLRGIAKALTKKALKDSRSDENVARRLIFRLIRLEDDGTATTRIRVFWEEIDPMLVPLVESLIESRIVVVDWDDKERKPILELGYHELVQAWADLLQWVKEDWDFLFWRQRLRWKRRDWEQGGHASELLLLDKRSLDEARGWGNKRADDLVDLEKLYIEKSEVEYRRRLWRRLLLTELAALLLLVVLASGILLWKAAKDAAHARSVTLAAEASRLADRKLDLALLLALQASKVSETAEARGVALSLTAGNPSLRYFLRRPVPLAEKEGAGLPGKEEQPEEIRGTAFGTGDLIATGGVGKVFLWDAKQGTPIGLLDAGAPVPIVSLVFSPDGTLLASGSEAAGFIHLWNLQNLADPKPFDPIPTDGSTQNLAFSPEGSLLAWNTPSGIHVWEINRGTLVQKIPRRRPTKDNWVSGLAFGPSGVLASATKEGQINLWNPRTRSKQPLLLIPKLKGSVLGVAFPPGAGTLISAGSYFQRWNLTDGQPIGQPCNLLAGPGDEVISVAFSRDGRVIASGHLDRKIRLWDVSEQDGCRVFETLTGHSGLIWTLSFGPLRPGKRLASLISGGEGGDLILWEAAQKTPTFSLPLGRRSPRGFASLAVSPDGSLVGVGDSQGQLALFDGRSLAKLDTAQSRNQHSINRIVFRQNGRDLVTGDVEGAVLLWDVQQRHLRLRTPLVERGKSGEDPIRSLATSQDNSWVAAGTQAGQLIVWQPDKSIIPAWTRQLAHEKGPVLSMTFITESPFSRSFPFFRRRQKEHLVTGGSDGSLILWDPETGEKIQTVAAHDHAVTSLASGANHHLLASGSQDRNVRLWRLDRGLQPEEILSIGRMVWDLALSPHGDLLAVAGGESSKNDLTLWDLKAHIPLGSGFETPGKIGSVAFAPSGESLFMSGKGISTWWDLRSGTWSSRACDLVRRNFFPIERERYLEPSEQPVTCSPMQESKSS